MRPHWLNEDGTHKTGVAYWVRENFLQWQRGEHHAHVDLWHELGAAEAYRHAAFVRSLKKREEELAAAQHQSMLQVLPAWLREDAQSMQTIPNTNTKAFVRGLRYQFAEV